MKALKVVWGLLVDDARLAIGTLLSFILLLIVSLGLHWKQAAGWIFVVGLVTSIAVSLLHEAAKRSKS